jgi:hypothetical protein
MLDHSLLVGRVGQLEESRTRRFKVLEQVFDDCDDALGNETCSWPFHQRTTGPSAMAAGKSSHSPLRPTRYCFPLSTPSSKGPPPGRPNAYPRRDRPVRIQPGTGRQSPPFSVAPLLAFRPRHLPAPTLSPYVLHGLAAGRTGGAVPLASSLPFSCGESARRGEALPPPSPPFCGVPRRSLSLRPRSLLTPKMRRSRYRAEPEEEEPFAIRRG